MRSLRCLQDVIDAGLCISCGACASAAAPGAIDMVLDEGPGVFRPKVVDPGGADGRGEEFEVCPGRGYPIEQLSRELFGDSPEHSLELGRYRLAVAARSSDAGILAGASSGGVMTQIAAYLLDTGRVEGVTASRFVYGGPGPRTEAFIARNLDDLIEAQGSKYCPTATNALVRDCVSAGGRYLFLGTPCQVAALRMATARRPELAETFPFTMANFCGGYRDFRDLDHLVSVQGMAPDDATFFRFRGGGQPGSLLARDAAGRSVSAPYPGYAHQSRFPKQPRCVYCVDATGELADFACGDAWIDRFAEDEQPWSLILARSAEAEEVVLQMRTEFLLVTRDVSFDEIVHSQRFNLESKKFRQRKRMALCRLLLRRMPRWDTELPSGGGSYAHELRVLIGKYRTDRRIRAQTRRKPSDG